MSRTVCEEKSRRKWPPPEIDLLEEARRPRDTQRHILKGTGNQYADAGCVRRLNGVIDEEVSNQNGCENGMLFFWVPGRSKFGATDHYIPTLLELPLKLTNITKRPPSRSVTIHQ